MTDCDMIMAPSTSHHLHRVLRFCLICFDGLILFGLCRTYLNRLKDLANDPDVDTWRKDQQQEWDRLGISLALLATMHAAILAITPHAPPLAFAVWLGGGALAVCTLFIVQYFSVTAFGTSDEDMQSIVNSKQPYIDHPLLAVAMITPIVASCWAAILFTIGIFDYIIKTDLGGWRYRVVAFVPVGAGLIAVLFTVLLGQRMLYRVEARYEQGQASDPLDAGESPPG